MVVVLCSDAIEGHAVTSRREFCFLKSYGTILLFNLTCTTGWRIALGDSFTNPSEYLVESFPRVCKALDFSEGERVLVIAG